MPNQYNAAPHLSSDVPAAAPNDPWNVQMIASGFTPGGTGWVTKGLADAPIPSGEVDRNPYPATSGQGGAVPNTKAFDGGSGTEDVIDRAEAPFILNENPWKSYEQNV